MIFVPCLVFLISNLRFARWCLCSSFFRGENMSSGRTKTKADSTLEDSISCEQIGILYCASVLLKKNHLALLSNRPKPFSR